MRIDIDARFEALEQHWKAQPIGQVNGMDVMVMKSDGEFVWHVHEDTDDCFILFRGALDIHLRDRSTWALAACSSCREALSTSPAPIGRSPRPVDRERGDASSAMSK